MKNFLKIICGKIISSLTFLNEMMNIALLSWKYSQSKFPKKYFQERLANDSMRSVSGSHCGTGNKSSVILIKVNSTINCARIKMFQSIIPSDTNTKFLKRMRKKFRGMKWNTELNCHECKNSFHPLLFSSLRPEAMETAATLSSIGNNLCCCSNVRCAFWCFSFWHDVFKIICGNNSASWNASAKVCCHLWWRI